MRGHGVHAIGTAVGEFIGVAKRANPFAVKALDDQGAGPTSDIFSGLNGISQWVSSLSGNSATNGTTATDSVQVTEGPHLGGQVQNEQRQIRPVSHSSISSLLPSTISIPSLSQFGSGNVTMSIGGGEREWALPSVVNLSLDGTTDSNSLYSAVKALVDQGVGMVITACNNTVEVRGATSAEAVKAMAVGYTDGS